MKRIQIVTFFCFSFFVVKAQITNIQSNDTCFLCFSKQFSHYWKNDSVAHNGFRFMAYDLLLKCNKFKVNELCLIEQLGKPNKITNDNLGSKYYIYYVTDGFAMPNEKYIPNERDYIFFRFDKGKDYIAHIGEGHYD